MKGTYHKGPDLTSNVQIGIKMEGEGPLAISRLGVEKVQGRVLDSI